jgi:SAM-dependent methyltransferase
MDAVERLSYDTVLGASLSASEHVQRYRWAAGACGGLRVLDLCCGVGYGSLILREQATSVVGVDYDESAVRTAREQATATDSDVDFQLGDALRWLDEDLSARFDAIVCFEGLEHLSDFDRALAAFKRHAERGVRLLVSVPNSRTFAEENEFHVTNLDYDGAMSAFASLPNGRLFFQYAAEGALIADETQGVGGMAQLTVPDRTEPEYANTFLCTVNVPDDELARAAAHMRFTVAPYQTRELRNLARANEELWATNRQLGRQLREIAAELEDGNRSLAVLRSFDTAAGSAIRKLVERAETAERELETARASAESAGAGWARYYELRKRKVVRLALWLSRRLRP